MANERTDPGPRSRSPDEPVTTSSVRDAAAEARHKAAEGAERMQENARTAARKAREEAERRADGWTTSVGEHTHHLARALEAAADRLREDDEPTMADMAGEAARQVDRMGGYLEDENPAAMLDDFEGMSRRNPGAFLGSAFTVGLLAGRFLRSSRPGDGTNGAHGASGGNGHVRTDDRRSASSTYRGSAPTGTTRSAEHTDPVTAGPRVSVEDARVSPTSTEQSGGPHS